MSGVKKAIKYLTHEQTIDFFSVISNRRDRALFAVIYHYGLRVSEATLLRMDDIDLVRRHIFVHRLKNGHSGERPLLGNTAKTLETYLSVRLATGPEFFTGRQGGLGRQRIQQLFQRYAILSDLPRGFTVRCLRHSIATHLLDAGFGIEFVQEHLGHVNIQNTLIYAQLTDKRREKIYQQVEEHPDIVKV